MDSNQIKTKFAQNYETANQTAKTFSDMLRERRGFVQQGEDASWKQTAESVTQGSNGVAINPVAAIDDFLKFNTANSNTTSQLTQEAGQYNQQATQALSALASLLNSEQDRALTKRGQDLQYGVGTAGDTASVDQYANDVVTGLRKLEDLPAAVRQAVSSKLSQIGYVPDPKAAEKRNAQSTLDELEKLYGRGDAANIGTGKDLSLADEGGPLAKLRAFFAQNVANNTTNVDRGKEAESYEAILANAVGQFSQAFGSGTPQEGEAQRLIKSAPKQTTSDDEAKRWFASMRELLATPEMKIKNGQESKTKTDDPLGLFGK